MDESEEAGAIVFAKYEHAMSLKGVLDFDSILIETAKLLERNPVVRDRWQYRYVQIDEAQDTDSVQWRIVKAITQRHGSALAVGDENQGMYSWRGSESNLTAYFCALFPSAVLFPLPVNYRSTQSIIDYCKQIAPHQNETITKLTGVKDTGVAPVFKLFTLEKDEAKYVVNASVDLGNTAILARTNAQLLPFENECNDRQLRYKLLGKSGFWAQHEIKDAVAIVGCCIAPSDNAVLRMLSSRCDATKFLRKSDTHDRPSTITMLKRQQASMLSGTNGKPPLLHRIMANYDTGDPSQNEVLRNLSYMMHSLRGETEKLSGKDAMMRVIDRFGMLSAYDVAEDEDDKKNFDNDPRANILKMADYAQLKGGLTGLYEYLQRVNKARHARTDCLTLSTIHQSKGKEWKKVFVVGVVDEILPHIKGDPEEEARIFFVACSRAAETLTVTASGIPSPFIANLVKVPDGKNNNLLIDEWEGFRLQG